MATINRRELLRRTMAGTVAGILVPRSLAEARNNNEKTAPSPCSAQAWRKHGVVLEPTEPWEGDHIQNFTCPAEPIGKDRWRLWYSALSKKYSIAYAEGVPGEPMTKVPATCTSASASDGPFTVGHLPERWNPVQVVHIRLHNGKHRIYFWAHGPGILRYLAADSDDGRRYTVTNPLRPILYHPNDRAANGVSSPDAYLYNSKKSFTRPADEPPAISQLISNDATTVYQLPDGSFEMYSVALVPVPKHDPAYVASDNMPGLLRVIDRYRSEDGLHFEDRRRVVQRDTRDPVDQQFYHLAVTHTPKGRVGMLGHYRVEAQTMDLEWCFSNDGLKWQRPQRAAWLPRGSKSEPDSYGIYPPASLVQLNDRFHLFYTGVNSAHNGKHSHGKPRTVIMHATTDSIWA